MRLQDVQPIFGCLEAEGCHIQGDVEALRDLDVPNTVVVAVAIAVIGRCNDAFGGGFGDVNAAISEKRLTWRVGMIIDQLAAVPGSFTCGWHGLSLKN